MSYLLECIYRLILGSFLCGTPPSRALLEKVSTHITVALLSLEYSPLVQLVKIRFIKGIDKYQSSV